MLLMGKLAISKAIFDSYVTNCLRVYEWIRSDTFPETIELFFMHLQHFDGSLVAKLQVI